jgi:CDP-diacylglycerol--serine O-phosphatidyltransferase
MLMALMIGVGSLMVSTIRFPSSKQPKGKVMLAGLVIAAGLLAWLQTRFFALFFVFYICATLLLNIAWRSGWRGVPEPVVYAD